MRIGVNLLTDYLAKRFILISISVFFMVSLMMIVIDSAILIEKFYGVLGLKGFLFILGAQYFTIMSKSYIFVTVGSFGIVIILCNLQYELIIMQFYGMSRMRIIRPLLIGAIVQYLIVTFPVQWLTARGYDNFLQMMEIALERKSEEEIYLLNYDYKGEFFIHDEEYLKDNYAENSDESIDILREKHNQESIEHKMFDYAFGTVIKYPSGRWLVISPLTLMVAKGYDMKNNALIMPKIFQYQKDSNKIKIYIAKYAKLIEDEQDKGMKVIMPESFFYEMIIESPQEGVDDKRLALEDISTFAIKEIEQVGLLEFKTHYSRDFFDVIYSKEYLVADIFSLGDYFKIIKYLDGTTGLRESELKAFFHKMIADVLIYLAAVFLMGGLFIKQARADSVIKKTFSAIVIVLGVYTLMQFFFSLAGSGKISIFAGVWLVNIVIFLGSVYFFYDSE